eukprot:TRINITY_DN21017_c0_g1_i1.p1 TRINITY_DN21017_c0_g1~~TRINITY_DN21017_c0_g1_i1.p1  ORF type:complete len:203 (-),score=14.73 TRINITY_DN21017_c0_g1_i1:67-675(-)
MLHRCIRLSCAAAGVRTSVNRTFDVQMFAATMPAVAATTSGNLVFAMGLFGENIPGVTPNYELWGAAACICAGASFAACKYTWWKWERNWANNEKSAGMTKEDFQRYDTRYTHGAMFGAEAATLLLWYGATAAVLIAGLVSLVWVLIFGLPETWVWTDANEVCGGTGIFWLLTVAVGYIPACVGGWCAGCVAVAVSQGLAMV